ncbi:MAG: hypothetical protein EOP51_34610 [Sphingobacteriales bacterium]|nr:MAG: hypothetical protein EOP51_34610 [Sphingobacteriales bacterium]
MTTENATTDKDDSEASSTMVALNVSATNVIPKGGFQLPACMVRIGAPYTWRNRVNAMITDTMLPATLMIFWAKLLFQKNNSITASENWNSTGNMMILLIIFFG